MGKKKLKKENKNNKNENKANNDANTLNNNILDENEEEDLIDIKIDLKAFLDIINSNNSSDIYKLSTFLANYDYDILCQEEEKRSKEIFALTSNNFLLPYLNIYLNNNINEYTKKIKYNIISSTINIFSTFSENSKYEINYKYLYNKILSEIFYQSLLSYSKENNSCNIKDIINYKTIMNIFDLFQLIIDIIKTDDKINSIKNLINYDLIINVLVNEYIFNNNNIDVKNRAQFLLFSLASNFYIEINDKNNIKILLNYIVDNHKRINIDSFLYFISFYLSICNNGIDSLKIIIEKINGLTDDINIFNKDINDLFQFLSKAFELEDKHNKTDNDKINNINMININITDEEIQNKLNTFLLNCKTLYGLIKIYSDIIENFNDGVNGGLIYPEDLFLNNMTISINKIFNNSNKALNQLYNNNFISSLIILIDNIEKNKIESYYLNNNDSILQAKEYLNEIILLILGIINNIILKLNHKFKKGDIDTLLNIIYNKLNNYKSTDDEELSLIILLLRNMLEKKNINIENMIEFNNKEELTSLDYKLLFCIFNYYLNDENIKINIIDIIAFIYSTEITNDNNWYEMIKELNNLLITLLYNEKNIEIVSHVINAFMDIYQWDDPPLNQILKNSNILNIMSNGIKTFKKKMENQYKLKELTDDTYEYISETLTNMKRFIKYKENI